MDSALPHSSITAMLELSGFKQVSEAKWAREFSDDRRIDAYIYGDPPVGETVKLTFAIWPTIGDHTIEDHARSALLACVIMSIIQTISDFSERGVIKQNSLVGDCRIDNVDIARTLATYPYRMQQSDLCLGFRTVLADGIRMEYGY